MDLRQLRCFVAVAEELHFGRAARRLEMMPAALGRHIRLLEESLGARLLSRTTRNVALTEQGADLLPDARGLLAKADELSSRYREKGRHRARTLKLGTIDTAAAGLLPLAAAWVGGSRDPTRDQMLALLSARLAAYAASA